MNMQVLDARRDASGGYKVDVSRGQRIGRVSSEWFSRPDDQRFLSLGDLARTVRDRSERSRTRVVESALIHVEANRNDPERLALILPGTDTPVTPTHWSFGQLASQVGAPAAYLRQLPAPLAAINLQYGLTSHRAEQIKTLETDDSISGSRLELRAVTGPDYGRIYDHELVEAVQKIAGNGTGDTRWKVPGVLDWSTGIYNPRVDITRDTTTLYASDRDVFLFLVDDLNPIEAGRLPDGSPDLFFRGFYCWNSEVGAKTLGMASFYLRAVCQNRNLWGVEDFEEISIRHSKYAANRFAHEAAPALEGFANSSPQPFINGIKAARERIVARTDEDRSDFLRGRGFAHNPGLRRELQGFAATWSNASPDDQGDALVAARAIGADTELLDDCWWMPTLEVGPDRRALALGLRALPGSILVDHHGKRYMDEARSYMATGRSMHEHGAAEHRHWLIMDERFLSRHIFPDLSPRDARGVMMANGTLKRGESIAELAVQCRLDPATLCATVERFNGFARAGVDDDFHRGATAYDRYWADPAHRPNPSLGPIERPPFWAAVLRPGDLGTNGGVKTDPAGRVLDGADRPIDGLYAAGNGSGSPFRHSYPGAGATIGAAATYGYIAARHAAKRRVNASSD